MKHHDMSQRRAHYRTHFGPEPEDEQAKKQKRKEKASIYKESLINQMKSQELNTKQQITMERAFENIVVDSHQIRLQEEERRALDKDKEQKKQFKETWEH